MELATSTEGGASEAGVDAVRRALAPNGEGEAGAIAAPAIAPTDDATGDASGGAASEPAPDEPALKGAAQKRIERLFNLLAALRKLADRLEDLNASNKGEPSPRRTTNGAVTNGQTFRRFMPAYDKLICDCESDLMRAGKAAGELDENL